MMTEPATRPSLVIRLRDPQDNAAWGEFLAVYEPLLLRVMRQRGLQEADARDVTQQVVLAVNQAIDRWRPDGRPESFRRWLFTIARKLALKCVQRTHSRDGLPRRGVGGTDTLDLLQRLPEAEPVIVTAFDDEYRNEVFSRAAELVRGEFRDSTWQAFWQTCVLHEPIADVARTLGMSTGNVYVARSRVIARLRKIVEECEVDHDA